MTRALLALAALGCGPKPSPTGVSAGDAIVLVTSNVRDARLYIDGRFIGPLAALRGGVAVEPGTHRLELRHEDYFSRYAELALARAERKQLTLDLAAVLP